MKTSMKTMALGLIGVVMVAACGKAERPAEKLAGVSEPPPPHVTPEHEGLDPAALAAASQYAEGRNARALIVGRHGHIVYEKYWQGSNFETPVDTGEFNAALSAMTVGIAAEDRKIRSLDEPVSGGATLRELLHSNPQAVPAVVEKAVGEKYADFLSQRLWKRLGAADAALSLDRCCLVARQGDWMRVAQLLVNDGVYEGDELVPPRWMHEMLEPSPANPNFGFQIWLGSPYSRERTPAMSEPFVTDDVRYLRGTGGNRLWAVPSLNLVILLTGSDADPAADWDESRIPNTIIRGMRDYVPRNAGPGKTNLRDIVPSH